MNQAIADRLSTFLRAGETAGNAVAGRAGLPIGSGHIESSALVEVLGRDDSTDLVPLDVKANEMAAKLEGYASRNSPKTCGVTSPPKRLSLADQRPARRSCVSTPVM